MDARGDDPATACSGTARLPYIRNFKLMQQGGHGDRNRGAALGQYYLSKKGTFVEEWGNHIEPIGITYYTLIDIGNILLFEPQDTLLREKLREGADLLLSLQHPDGSFDVAYDKLTGKALFTDLEDLRPTFYGLLVAHRILGERKYLDAALRGADWYVGHAVDRGRFLGVCGDARFINDFATVQSAQALLETYEASGNERYLEAAVRAARIYACSIYTHPQSKNVPVRRKDCELRDWQLSQTGLCFEHGGSTGSATKSGPILLTSHCGLYTRLAARNRATASSSIWRARRPRPGRVPQPRHEDRHLLLVAVRPRPGTFPASCLVAAGMDRRLPALRSRMPQRRADRLPTGLRDAQGRAAAHHGIRTRTLGQHEALT